MICQISIKIISLDDLNSKLEKFWKWGQFNLHLTYNHSFLIILVIPKIWFFEFSKNLDFQNFRIFIILKISRFFASVEITENYQRYKICVIIFLFNVLGSALLKIIGFFMILRTSSGNELTWTWSLMQLPYTPK